MANFLVIGIILLIVGIAVTYIWKAKKAEPNASAVRQQEGVPGKTGTLDVIANAIVQKISKVKKSLHQWKRCGLSFNKKTGNEVIG